MSSKGTSSRPGCLPAATMIGLLSIAALVVGYLYGTMTLQVVLGGPDSWSGLAEELGFSSTPVDEAQEALGSAPGTEKSTGDEQTTAPDKGGSGAEAVVLDPVQLFRVQLGSFKVEQNALDLEQQLEELGIAAFVSAGPPYRVSVGIGPNRQAVGGVAGLLKKKGLETYVAAMTTDRVNTAELSQSEAVRVSVGLLQQCRTVLTKGASLWMSRFQGTAGTTQETQTLSSLTAALDQAEEQLSNAGEAATPQAKKLVELCRAAVEALQPSADGDSELPTGDVQLLALWQQYQRVMNQLQ